MYSTWIDSCKASVLQSSEWKRISQELHRILSDRLSRDCVGFFADLKFDQQLAYIKQIKRYDLKNTDIYQSFLDKLNEIIEKSIAIEVNKMNISTSRLNKILHITSEGAAKLLHDFPVNEIQNQLSGLSNVSLSQNLRKEIWKLLFNQQKINGRNNDDQTQSVEETNSSNFTQINEKSKSSMNNTFKITEKCENILIKLSQTIQIPQTNPHRNQIPVFNDFNDLNTLLPITKNIMIKYHEDIGYFNNENNEIISLCDIRYFYFIIPLLVCISDFLIDPISNKIKKYELFELKTLKCLKSVLKTDTNSINLNSIRFGNDLYKEYYQIFLDLVINKSPKLFSALKHIAISAQLISTSDNIDSDNQSIAIRAICEPLIELFIEYWFITTVNIETCLHIWDQLLLKKFDTLPLIMCALLSIICDKLKDCQNVDGFVTVSKRYLTTIHYSQLLKEMQHIKSFRIDLQPKLPIQKNEPDITEKIKDKSDFSSVRSEIISQPRISIITRPSISVYTKSLLIAMIMVGKLQRIREQHLERTQKQPAHDAITEDIDIKTDDKEEKQDTIESQSKDNDDVPKSVTTLVLEECIVQIMRGFRDISNL